MCKRGDLGGVYLKHLNFKEEDQSRSEEACTLLTSIPEVVMPEAVIILI